MDSESADVDVHKLLQQLEELKRKKAHNEKKLKKIAKSVPKVNLLLEKKKARHNLTQIPEQIFESKSISNQSDNSDKENITLSKSCTATIRSSCNMVSSHPVSDVCASYEKVDQLIINSSNSFLRIPDVSVSNGDKKQCSQAFCESNIYKDIQKTTACELSSSKSYTAKNSVLIASSNEHQTDENRSRKRLSQEAERDDVDVLIPDVRKKQKINDGSLSTNDVEPLKDVESVPMDVKARVEEKSCEISGASNKVDSNEYHHNSSYLTEECFDNDMTCVLSSQVMSCEEDATKEESHHEKGEKGAGDFVCQSSKPVLSELSFSASLQSSCSDFELPKFSSPTDDCLFDEAKKEQDKVIGSDHCTLNLDNCIPSRAQVESELYSPEKTYDPSKLKHILSTGLSSVLDAHYESPGKFQKDESPKCLKSVGFKIADGMKEVRESTEVKPIQSNEEDIGSTACETASTFPRDAEKCSPVLVKNTIEVEVIDLGVDDSVMFIPSSAQLEDEDVSTHQDETGAEEKHVSLKKDEENSSSIRDMINYPSCKRPDHLDTNLQVSITVDNLMHQVCDLYSAPVMEENHVQKNIAYELSPKSYTAGNSVLIATSNEHQNDDEHSQKRPSLDLERDNVDVEDGVGCYFQPESEVLVVPETEFFGADDFTDSEVLESTILPNTEANEQSNNLEKQIVKSEVHDKAVPNISEMIASGSDDFSDSELVEDTLLLNTEIHEEANNLNRDIVNSESHDKSIQEIPETEVLCVDHFADSEVVEIAILPNAKIAEQNNKLNMQITHSEAHDKYVPNIPESEMFGSDDFSNSELVEDTILPNAEIVKASSLSKQIVESESHDNSVLNIPETEVLGSDDFSDSELVENTILFPNTENHKVNHLKNQAMVSASSDKAVQEIPETEVLCTDDFVDSDVLESTTLPNREFCKVTNNLNVQTAVPDLHSQAKLHKTTKLSDGETNFLDSEQPSKDFKAPNSKTQTNRVLSEKWEQSANQNFPPDSEFMETNLFDTENSQELGNYKSVPFLPEEEEAKVESSKDVCLEENDESCLGFVCCLNGNCKETVSDVQMMIFNDNTYVFVQFTTCIEVWRHQAHEDWMKIFIHQVDDALQLKKLCLLKSKDYLSLVLLLNSQQEHCLQFVLFERNSKVIKVLENSHWLNEGQSSETVLLCDLNGLMFATAQGDDIFKVFAHTFADLSESPRLISVELGSTSNHLLSICKIEKLPNALMGISQGTLYVWHLLEARLVTAVTLQPQDYLPIIDCVWATVEKGLVFFITTCEDENNFVLSQLLAANLATGFCQTVTPFNIRPANLNDQESDKTVKAKYCEPYLLASYKSQAFFWSALDEYCCAVLDENHEITAVTMGQDVEGYHLVAVGNKTGCVNFYKLN